MDVARKLIILGREMGLPLELTTSSSRASCRPASRRRLDRGIHGSAAAATTAPMRSASRRRARAARCCATSARSTADGRGDGRPRRARCPPRVRQHRPDRQHRALRHRGATATTRSSCRVRARDRRSPPAGVFADLLRVCAYLGAQLVTPPARRAARDGVRAGLGRQRRHRLRRPGLLGGRARRSRHRARARRARACEIARDRAASRASCRSSREQQHRRPGGAGAARGAEARLRLRARDRQGHSARFGPRRLGGVRGRRPWLRPTRCSPSRCTQARAAEVRDAGRAGCERRAARRQHRAVAVSAGSC